MGVEEVSMVNGLHFMIFCGVNTLVGKDGEECGEVWKS